MTALDFDVPTLQTRRLTLRGPEAEDIEQIAAFFADGEHSWGFGGPKNEYDAWRWFSMMVGHWVLRGYGNWILETEEGEAAGMVGIWHPLEADEPELVWVMFRGYEGRGYALEAATELRRFAYDVLEFDTLCSNIYPGNTRSIALAERMNARFEGQSENSHHSRSLVYRHPSPADLGIQA